MEELRLPREPPAPRPLIISRLRVGVDRGPGLAANAARMAKCSWRAETTHARS